MYREVLGRDDVDAVTVVVPDQWHAIMTIRAAEARKDIYCEKPLSLTIAQGRDMVNAVKKHQRISQVGTQIHAGENYHKVESLGMGLWDRRQDGDRQGIVPVVAPLPRGCALSAFPAVHARSTRRGAVLVRMGTEHTRSPYRLSGSDHEQAGPG